MGRLLCEVLKRIDNAEPASVLEDVFRDEVSVDQPISVARDAVRRKIDVQTVAELVKELALSRGHHAYPWSKAG
jgi:hypothetical protein